MAKIANCNSAQSVEDQAIFNVDLQRFIDKLTPIELEFVELKAVVDLAEYHVIERMKIKRLTAQSLKGTLRKKFNVSFGV